MPLKILGLLALIVMTASLTSSSWAGTTSVRVSDNYFVRARGVATVTVPRGTTVRWVFVGRSAHNVTVDEGPVKFGSDTMTSGNYRKRLTKRGDYRMICTIHGGSDMSMLLRVR
jgi:plastocyanin